MNVECTNAKVIKENFPEIRKQAGIGLFVWNIKSDYLYWDDGMFYLFAVDKNKFKNNYSSFNSLLSLGDSIRISQSLKEAINNKDDFVNTFAINLSDGSQKYIKAYSSFVNDLLVGVNIKITEEEYIRSHQLTEVSDFSIIRNKKARLSMYSLKRAFSKPSDFSNLNLSNEWTACNSFGLTNFNYRVLSVDKNKHLQMEWLNINDTSSTHYSNFKKLITNLGKAPIIVWVNGEENLLDFGDSISIASGAMHKIKYWGSCYSSVTFFNYFSKQ